jgi:hypothetical protein
MFINTISLTTFGKNIQNNLTTFCWSKSMTYYNYQEIANRAAGDGLRFKDTDIVKKVEQLVKIFKTISLPFIGANQ